MPVSPSAATVDAIKKARTLGIASLNNGSGEAVAFKVSLMSCNAAIANRARSCRRRRF
jgi:hypothetical protein